MKKKLLYIIIFLFVTIGETSLFAQPQDVLIDMCVNKSGDDATYLKDFIVQLDAAAPGEKAPVAKFSMILSKSTLYRLTVCNSEDSEGEAIIRLFSTSSLVGTNLDPSSGQTFNAFDFECNVTGVYHVFVSFQDGRSGNAIGILSFIKKL